MNKKFIWHKSFHSDPPVCVPSLFVEGKNGTCLFCTNIQQISEKNKFEAGKIGTKQYYIQTIALSWKSPMLGHFNI